MEYKAKRFVEAIKKNFEKDNIIFDSELFEEYTNNTLGFKRNIIGVVFPKNKWEVIKIVDLANQFRVSLYPISRGKNTGYGDKTPIKDNCFIVDLSNMNKITEFDNINGFVRVESGVTQEQLYNFLKKSKSNFWMDVTGSFIDSSIVGCSLDGGLGHSPKGNRRKIISDIEIVKKTSYSYPEHFMGILKSKLVTRDRKLERTRKSEKEYHTFNIDNPASNFPPPTLGLSLFKYLLLDKFLSPLFTPFLNLGNNGSILELYIKKK